MGFWKSFAKFAIPIGAGAATLLTGGAAAPLLGMALGAGSGLATSKLSGQSWGKSLMNAGIGGALGGIGGGALKGMGGFGKFLGGKTGQALLGAGGNVAKKAVAGMGQPGYTDPGTAYRTPTYTGAPIQQSSNASNLGYLNPIGLQPERRTQLYGMGTRQYNA